MIAAIFRHLPDPLKRMGLAVLRVEPDHLIRIIRNSRFLQCLHIPLVALLSLRVVGFEDAHNAPVSQFNQVSGRKIGSPAVVQKNLRPVQKLGMYSLYKYIGDMIAVEHLIQIHMPAENLALARLDDEPVDILLQQLLETLCLKASRVARIFQQNTVTVLRQHLVNSLHDARKNVIRKISCHDRDIFGRRRVP